MFDFFKQKELIRIKYLEDEIINNKIIIDYNNKTIKSLHETINSDKDIILNNSIIIKSLMDKIDNYDINHGNEVKNQVDDFKIENCGCVYLLKSSKENFTYKIGMTKNNTPYKRLEELQKKDNFYSYYQLKLYKSIPLKNPLRFESILHKIFYKERICYVNNNLHNCDRNNTEMFVFKNNHIEKYFDVLVSIIGEIINE